MPTILTQELLQKTAITAQKDLLTLPMIGAEATLSHMSGRSGIHGSHIISNLSGELELAPFDRKAGTEENFKIESRELVTRLGLTVSHFAPDEIYNTIHGSIEKKGPAMKDTDIARAVLSYAMAALGQKLNMAIFRGRRKEDGKTTLDLFDGFDTITEKEITAGNLSTDKGNYIEIPAITPENALASFTHICQSAADELQDAQAKLYVSRRLYQAYCHDYAALRGAVPYNTQYQKTYVEGFEGQIEIVPLVSKKDSQFIHLSTAQNMVYGYGAGMPSEGIEIARLAPVDLTLIAKILFGVQFATLDRRALLVAKVGS